MWWKPSILIDQVGVSAWDQGGKLTPLAAISMQWLPRYKALTSGVPTLYPGAVWTAQVRVGSDGLGVRIRKRGTVGNSVGL